MKTRFMQDDDNDNLFNSEGRNENKKYRIKTKFIRYDDDDDDDDDDFTKNIRVL